MRRREFIAGLGCAAAWPVVAGAQQPEQLPTIGFLGTTTPAVWGPWTAAFVQRLRELGWIEGRTIAIEYRWAEGHDERYAEIAAELVRLKVAVIVSIGTAVIAVKQATSVIPIVFAAAPDPVGNGLVASLARPGGNVTGLSSQSAELAGKRVELLREAVPGLRRLAIMANVGYPGALVEIGEVQAAARVRGLEIVPLSIRRAEDIAPAFDVLKGRAEALYVVNDALVNGNRIRINTLSLAARLPTMHGIRDSVEVGGLMSYGANNLGLPTRRRTCRQDSAWREVCRPPGRAADKVRSHHQSDDCQGARPYHPGDAVGDRRRGDPVADSGMVGPAMSGPAGPAAGAGAFILPGARSTTVSNLAFVSYNLSGKQETPMSAPILKKHAAHATGTISEEGDGQWRASLLVRDLARKSQQTRGPKFFHSEPTARAWITQQAALHGFTEGDFDINLELASGIAVKDATGTKMP